MQDRGRSTQDPQVNEELCLHIEKIPAQYSRVLQLAPKKPGLQRQTPGRTHTSSFWQASGPWHSAGNDTIRYLGALIFQAGRSMSHRALYPAPV